MKRTISILTAFVMLLSLLTLSVSAEDKTVAYGTDSLTLRVIDTFDGEDIFVDGYGSLGNATVKDSKILIVTNSGMFDAYGISTTAIASSDWSGMKYIVFEVKNTSDGDIYFCFQPTKEGGGSLFNSGALAQENPVMLYNTAKQECKAAKWSGTQAVNNRDGLVIPWNFEGYIFMPMYIQAGLGSTDSEMPEGGSFHDYGFHATPDDATFVELTIENVYACAELPEFHAPEVTEAPTETPTEAPTETPTEAPTEAEVPTETPTEAPTEAPTAAPTEGESETAVETLTGEIAAESGSGDTATVAESETTANDTGCASVIGLSAMVMMLAAACFARKH